MELKQAIILAGGLGTRLEPVTKFRPKPMVDVNGKPFLYFLIKKLKFYGFTKILILVGYKSNRIIDYFENNKIDGVHISFDYAPDNYNTAARLKKAFPKLQDYFLLLYGDNYAPVSLAEMKKQYKNSDKVQILCYRNSDGYSRPNLIISENNDIELYDLNRSDTRANWVDLGYMICPKKIIDLSLVSPDTGLGQGLLNKLVSQNQIVAHKTLNRYYTVTNMERLKQTRLLLQPRSFFIILSSLIYSSDVDDIDENIEFWLDLTKKIKTLHMQIIVIDDLPINDYAAKFKRTNHTHCFEKLQADFYFSISKYKNKKLTKKQKITELILEAQNDLNILPQFIIFCCSSSAEQQAAADAEIHSVLSLSSSNKRCITKLLENIKRWTVKSNELL